MEVKTKKYSPMNNSKFVSLTARISGAKNTSTWANELKAPTRDTAKVNAFGRTTCTKAGGSETKEWAKDAR